MELVVVGQFELGEELVDRVYVGFGDARLSLWFCL